MYTLQEAFFKHVLRTVNLKVKIFRKNYNYENDNEEVTGTLLVSVPDINFKDVYILLADKAAGHVEYL